MKFILSNIANNELRDPLLDFFAPDFFDDSDYAKDFSMPTDIRLENDSYIMEVELPGFKKEDINISFKDGYLTIKASRKEAPMEEKDNKHVVRRERFYGSTSRSFYVGDIDETAIKASFKDGILSLSFPNGRKEKEQEHLIAIE